jgi:transposase
MMGKQSAPEEFFYRFRLEDHVPPDHPLRALNAMLNFERARKVLAEYYSRRGRPSIDPELMLRMLLIGYAYGIRSERQLCNEVHLNLAYRWFCRLGLKGTVPNHSTFSKNRYGRFQESEVYRALFEQIVEQCRDAGLVVGESFAVDGSLVHGDASRERRVETLAAVREAKASRPVRDYLAALEAGNPAHESKPKYLSPTDPAAAWNTKDGPGRFGYFINYMIDTSHGVIVEVEATPARTAQEVIAAKAMLDRVAEAHALKPEVLTADKRYGTGSFLAWLKERKLTAHIPILDQQKNTKGLLTREAFTFDAEHNVYLCPQGKILAHRGTREKERIRTYCARVRDCRACAMREKCTKSDRRFLSVPIDEAVRQEASALKETEAYKTSRRLRKKVEMLFAHMKRQFRFTRLKLRGLDGAQEEFRLMAAVQNLRRLIRMRPPNIPKPCCA